MFVPHVGEPFAVQTGNGGFINLELISAEPLPLKPFDGRALGKAGFVRTDPFVLLFRWNGEVMFPQGVYTFNHPHLGEFFMNIVPVGPGETGWLYEAIFN
jgi:hypothetical protein